MRSRIIVVVLRVSVMASLAPSLARAQSVEQCIGPDAHDVVFACPSVAPATTARTVSQLAAIHREPPPEREPTAPGIELNPHDEIAAPHTEIRTRDLLEHEIATLERIAGRGASTQHAEVLARLADTYFELEAYWRTQARLRDQAVFEGGEASGARREQRDAETHATEARDGAVRTYARLIEEHPDYPSLDQVLFSLAFGLGEAQQFEQARQVYLRLLRDFPSSHYVPHAWLSFAEYYFEQGDMGAAAQFYEHVLETPPDTNTVYGYALYKLAWVHFNQEDFQGALTQFARVIEFATQHPDAHDAANLARQSRRELVLPYARVGRPAQALAFFRRYAEDDDQAIEMLESLGALYEDTGQWPEAIQVFHALMSERPRSDQLCHWQSRVTSAVISSRPKAEQVIEAHRLIDVMNAFAAGTHAPESIATCRGTTAGVLVELATAWHREAIGDGAQPGTNDRNTMQLARELYGLITTELPDMEQLQYPEIDRRDWPTLYRVSYFQAELLWRMDDFAGCGPAFDRVVELDPDGELSAEAVYGEVLCYDHVYEADYQPRERERLVAEAPARRSRRAPAVEGPRAPEAARDLTDAETHMIHAFQRYLCTLPDGDERVTVAYRLARVFYEARHFEEASVAFREVALNHPESELGEIAANLHLDSLNALFQREGRASCIASLRADVPPIAARYCDTPEAIEAHADLCPVVRELECEGLRLDAQALARAGNHRAAAPAYVAIARDHPTCAHRDEMLWNAAIEYEAARLLGRAIQVRQALVDGLPDTALARRAVYLIGANYHALAIYSSAADWYERFARESPDADEASCTEADRTAGTCAVAHVALESAVFFRLGLGETDHALADAELYERSYRRTRARETSQIVFSIGAIYERQEDWAHVASHYRVFLRDYARSARPDEILRANVQLGRAELALDRGDHAAPWFRAAVTTWSHGAEDAIARLDGTEEERAHWLALARDAVSTAEFYLAEERFEAFRAIRFPRYAGSRTLSSVMRWSRDDLGPWLARRFEALRAAEEAYDRIAPLQIPEWQIAAAARVGEMYRSIVDDVRSAPVPEEIENDDELYGIYITTLERVLDGSTPGADQQWDTPDDVICTPASTEPSCRSAPLRQASERFQYCLALATRVRWFDERSARCESELHAMDAAAYPLAAELRGTPAYDEAAPAPPRPIELDDDEPSPLEVTPPA